MQHKVKKSINIRKVRAIGHRFIGKGGEYKLFNIMHALSNRNITQKWP